MATYTTNLNLKKPAQSDKIRIADINGNMDDIDAAFGAVGTTPVATQMGDIREGMAIVSTGNAHGAIAAGQFVYVMGHDTLDDGLYTANEALAANATLSSSNLTAVSGGGLNALNGKITQVIMNDATKTLAQLLEARWTIDVPNDGAVHLIQATSNGGTWYGTISRYSANYGSGLVARYDGYSAAAFLNNGTVTTKVLSYQT